MIIKNLKCRVNKLECCIADFLVLIGMLLAHFFRFKNQVLIFYETVVLGLQPTAGRFNELASLSGLACVFAKSR
jgi:hypothetical protein